MSRTSMAAAILGFATVSVPAADIPGRIVKPGAPEPAPVACFEKDGLPTDAFGFTTGSDVADQGSLSAALEYNGGYKTRFGDAQNHLGKVQLSYGALRCLEVGPYLQGVLSRATVLGLRTDTSAAGGGVEIKYKILGRDVHGVGLTVVFDPNVNKANTEAKLLGVSLGSADFTSVNTTTRILMDFRLAPKLFGALNIEHTANWSGDNSYVRSSGLNFRAALAYQLSDSFYLGVEGSHQRVYSGNFLNKDVGNAWFAGPTFYWQMTKAVSLTGAYNIQVAGRAKTETFDLNLTNFNQHLAKLKLGISF